MSVRVLPVCGRRLCSSVGAAVRSSWPAPPAGPALCQDISASAPSGCESPAGETRTHKQVSDIYTTHVTLVAFSISRRKEALKSLLPLLKTLRPN